MRFSGGHRAAIAFDPQGLVFAAAGGGGQTKLFDVRAYGKGPFTTFAPDVGGPVNFSCVKFSYDGKLMLLGTTQGTLLLLDAFNGELVRSFSGHDNAQQLPLEACFRCGAAEGASNRLAPRLRHPHAPRAPPCRSPDADFVLSGSEDGTIWRWRVQSGEALPALQGHAGPVGALKVNPTRMMLASACSALCLWLPLPQQQQPTGMMGQ